MRRDAIRGVDELVDHVREVAAARARHERARAVGRQPARPRHSADPVAHARELRRVGAIAAALPTATTDEAEAAAATWDAAVAWCEAPVGEPPHAVATILAAVASNRAGWHARGDASRVAVRLARFWWNAFRRRGGA